MDTPAPLQIRRKPIAAGAPPAPSPVGLVRGSDDKSPPLPKRPDENALRVDIRTTARPASRGAEPSPPALQVPADHALRPQTSMPELGHETPPPSPFNAVPASTAATFGPSTTESKRNFMQTALSEARHFAGGLISHPIESTKHYSILRHSPALIFYRGPTTSVAITIFSSPDHPLPADRTLWLQQRGYSGDSGMKVKAFFNLTDSWLHVTPSNRVGTDQVAPDTERSWQRDIAKASKKLLKEKGAKKAHVPRETHVIRVPEASEDGYYRLILCTGREAPYGSSEASSRGKVLCSSPLFRVASTSSDSSVFRGASLSTMPLEMGVYVASMVATNSFNTYTAPVRTPVQAAMSRVRPGFVVETVGGIVHDELSDRVTERDTERDEEFFTAHQAHITRSLETVGSTVQPIGPESGPEPPFPLRFQGKVVPGTGRSQAELGIPTANLAGVSDEIRYRLNGVYFGWARVLLKGKGQSTKSLSPLSPTSAPPQLQQQQPLSAEWHQAIITIAPSPYARPSVKPAPLVTVHLLSLPASTPSLLGASLSTVIMGFLRPAATNTTTNTPAQTTTSPSPSTFTTLPPSPISPSLTRSSTSTFPSTSPSTPLSPFPSSPPHQLQQKLLAFARDTNLTLASLAPHRTAWQPDAAMALVGDKTPGLQRKLTEGLERVATVVLPGGDDGVPTPGLHWVGVRGRVGEAAVRRDRVLGVGGYWVGR